MSEGDRLNVYVYTAGRRVDLLAQEAAVVIEVELVTPRLIHVRKSRTGEESILGDFRGEERRQVDEAIIAHLKGE